MLPLTLTATVEHVRASRQRRLRADRRVGEHHSHQARNGEDESAVDELEHPDLMN